MELPICSVLYQEGLFMYCTYCSTGTLKNITLVDVDDQFNKNDRGDQHIYERMYDIGVMNNFHHIYYNLMTGKIKKVTN